VDYITKPFDIQELRLRVRNALRRASLGTLVNPITGLPTDPLIDERLTAMLRQESWTLLSVGIQGLPEFSDAYGFVASDDVLRAVALMVKNAAEDTGLDDPFIGHLGEADFLVISVPAKTVALRQRIISRIGDTIDHFYPMGDQEGREEQPGKLSLGIGMVVPEDGPFNSPMDVKLAALNSQRGV
jgi:GGDEF domain-containing protein